MARRSSSVAEQDTPEPILCARPSTMLPGRPSIDHLLGTRASVVEADGTAPPPSAPPSPPTLPADASAVPTHLAEGSIAAAEQERPDSRSTKLDRLNVAQPFVLGKFAQDRLPERGGFAAVMLAAKALPAPAPPTPYLMMLRVCQGKASPLDGVTPSHGNMVGLLAAPGRCCSSPRSAAHSPPRSGPISRRCSSSCMTRCSAPSTLWHTPAHGGRCRRSKAGASTLRGQRTTQTLPVPLLWRHSRCPRRQRPAALTLLPLSIVSCAFRLLRS